jgi:hypothetical protein
MENSAQQSAVSAQTSFTQTKISAFRVEITAINVIIKGYAFSVRITITLKMENVWKIPAQALLGASTALIPTFVIHVISQMDSWSPTLMDSASAMLINGSAKTKHSALTVIR